LQNTYIIEGDIVSLYERNGLTLIDIADSAISKPPVLHIKIASSIIKELVLQEDIRIQAKGKLAIYKQHGSFQFQAFDLKILQKPTRRKLQLKEWIATAKHEG
jgi:phospholipid N-methyltransferase